MQKIAQVIIFIIGLVMWANYMTSNNNGTFVSPPSIPGSGIIADLFKRSIELLAIGAKIREANAAEKFVTFPQNSITPFDTRFYPDDFIKKYNISTSFDVEKFDREAIRNIEICTIKANRIPSSNIIAMLDFRYNCLLNAGYAENDLSYIGGKLGTSK